jgi:phytanoyl-CoA hydroxylase
MATVAGSLSPDQGEVWRAQGYVLLRGIVATHACDAMLARAGEGGFFLPGLHHDPLFADVASDERVLEAVRQVLGPEVAVVLSRFSFLGPGAYGQPWHQDACQAACQDAHRYAPRDVHHLSSGPDHHVVAWLAVTEATLASGCPWVLPGSHTEPVHAHVPDRRPGSRPGDAEIASYIVDRDLDAPVPVLMDAGDVLLIDSHLVHRWTDNHSHGSRAAMAYHYSPAG